MRTSRQLADESQRLFSDGSFLFLKFLEANCSTDHKCHTVIDFVCVCARVVSASDVCGLVVPYESVCFMELFRSNVLTFCVSVFLSFRDLSENQIQAVPRKAFRGIVAVKNL